MPLPPNLITNRTARLPGDYHPQPNPAKRTTRRRHAPGEMNKAEARYSLELEARKRKGEILAWFFECVTLVVASAPPAESQPKDKRLRKTTYTPDFMVVFPDGRVEFHEVKGWWEEDALQKWKVVCEKYHWWAFRVIGG